MDAATYDATAFWLAHAHPAWMLAAIALAALALRAGLRLRAARRGAPSARAAGAEERAALRARHILLGKIAVLAIGLGFGGGIASVVWLRGWQVFGSAHGLVACAALALFVCAAVLGRRLENGLKSGLESGAGSRARQRHAAAGLLALLAAAAAFGTGFVLLP
ncbi:MAG: hypothetical protein OXU65_01480 [Deltaproteobacteria bacterium]|nr:hypothetical protein [Deltaproteobacteria bacterium]